MRPQSGNHYSFYSQNTSKVCKSQISFDQQQSAGEILKCQQYVMENSEKI